MQVVDGNTRRKETTRKIDIQTEGCSNASYLERLGYYLDFSPSYIE
jgi:hypothetical protein